MAPRAANSGAEFLIQRGGRGQEGRDKETTNSTISDFIAWFV